MTPEEFSKMQEDCRVTAMEIAIAWQTMCLQLILVDQPSGTQLSSLAVMRQKLQAVRTQLASVVFPGVPPANSDMYAGEFQEAFDKITQEIMAELESVTK